MTTIQLLQKFNREQSIIKDLDCKLDIKKYQLLIGQYRIVGFLGEGTFGRVFKAIHTLSEKKVAIKLIDIEKIIGKSDSGAIRQKYMRYFQTEETLMRRCHSAFVVKLYQTYQNSKCKIFVMEYCRNGGLDRYINRRGGLEQQEAIQILRQIILGLSELHRNNIIHRDLNPSNIFVHNGIFKIGDFGYGKLLQNELLQEGTICGNKHTRAPEVKEGNYGLKADIWALGMTYFMMIYSKCQLTQRSFAALSFIQNQQEFQFKTVSGVKLSASSRKFLRQTLQSDVSQRMNWQQTLQHEIFKVRFERLSEIYLPGIKEVFENLKGKKILRIQEALQENNMVEQQSLQKVQGSDLQIDTTLINQQYLQCRIAEFIFFEIIFPIEKKQLLDLQNRFHLQFVFLLLNRCRENIIDAKGTIKSKCSEQIGDCFRLQVKQLESAIFNKFVDLQCRLKEVQDKLSQIVFDRIMTIVSNDEHKQKQKFLTLFQRQSFTKNDQINFTCTKYVRKITKQLQGSKKDVVRIRKLIKNYKLINEIKVQELQGKRIHQKVSEMLEDQ